MVIVLNQQQRVWLLPLIIGVAIVAFDQLSKQWIIKRLGPVPLMDAIPLVGDGVQLIYSRNTGVAFSLLQGLPQLLTVLALLITAGVIYAYITQLPRQNLAVQISIGLIVGGALGNLIDRILLGYVIDFIQVGWWPVFNVADSAISVGAILLVLTLVRLDAIHSSQSQAAVQ